MDLLYLLLEDQLIHLMIETPKTIFSRGMGQRSLTTVGESVVLGYLDVDWLLSQFAELRVPDILGDDPFRLSLQGDVGHSSQGNAKREQLRKHLPLG
ncbi:MAG: hypothetical protein Q9M31_04310 [Mariprofundus sp.]|nr:hypothetical protein [Mariprofundus sp.]